jgi:hypothetical protein
MKNLVVLLAFASLLSGCGSFNFSVCDIVPSKEKINASLDHATLSYGSPDSDEPAVDLDKLSKEQRTQDFVAAWGFALADALKTAELFDKSAEKKLRLSVEILDVDVPFVAANVTIDITTTYKLVDMATDTTIYSDTVKSDATVPWDYAFFGYKRANEAINRSGRKNISTFISNLQKHRLLIK